MNATEYVYDTDFGPLEFSFMAPYGTPQVIIYARDGLTINGVGYSLSVWAFQSTEDEPGCAHFRLTPEWVMGEYNEWHKRVVPSYTFNLLKKYVYNVRGRWDSTPTDSARKKMRVLIEATLPKVLAEHPEALMMGRLASLKEESDRLAEERSKLFQRIHEIDCRRDAITREMKESAA